MFPVRRLILFAGAPCSGKSTIIEALQCGKYSALASSLGMGDPKAWPYITARRVQRMPDTPVDRMILHYDMLRQWRRAQFEAGYAEDASLALLGHAAELRIVTFWTAPAELLRRVQSRRKPLLELFEKLWARSPSRHTLKLANLCRLYTAPGEFNNHYRKWFDFCRSIPSVEHLVLDTTHWPPIMSSLNEWSANVGRTVCEHGRASSHAPASLEMTD